uniref:Uncharacterized protein n=1 Tax=Setaria italica TaxID=4555 RepID=K4ANH7_SETIT
MSPWRGSWRPASRSGRAGWPRPGRGGAGPARERGGWARRGGARGVRDSGQGGQHGGYVASGREAGGVRGHAAHGSGARR